MEQSCNKVKQPTELFQIKTDINIIQQISFCYKKIANFAKKTKQVNIYIRCDFCSLSWYQRLSICIKKHKKEGMNKVDEGLSPTQFLLGIPNLIFWTIFIQLPSHSLLLSIDKKMYEVNRYQVDEEG